jgi:hypothetical protein
MLRDRYYLGHVAYKGEEIRGRHEPLIDQVHEIIESRATAKNGAALTTATSRARCSAAIADARAGHSG